ncbi:AfsR/SARP family transcriptional regulator [Streptomyces xinghaiensis]|uniref:AfsR/SARP family transcriptional regulator n=1 Tax=Streptomyces xinghaiensis TaxID=1038928 RepID=UPI000D1CBA4C|nr:BTAD domain-containing putative transcriptional regulator [Streptomyces xinghaiensis]MZE81037.1 tetratricopeptide repeat protein [Streptomyces sp. SID5475]
MTPEVGLDSPVYRILGPLAVETPDRRSVRIPRGRQQTVLSALLLGANRVVGIDHLIDVLWDDDPPPTARTQVHIAVSALRTGLTKAEHEHVILTREPGYLLQVPDEQVDARLFTALMARAEELARRDRTADAAEHTRRALALWRGPALSGMPSPRLQARAVQLNEERLAATETSMELQLRLGRHHQLIGELSALVDEHPLRERARSLLMLALFRSGRQAEALETYRRGRRLLIEQLGLEPGEELRNLESAILAGDPGLRPGRPVSSVRRPEPPAPPGLVAPRQLPTDISDFAGREGRIDEATRLLGDDGDHRATRVVVLAGKPGAGKSALAVHLAHRLADRFPDGQFYCDLGGTRNSPAAAGDVLGRFLRALGIPGTSIPESTEERAEMYRHLLASRRALVVLDDAATDTQVQPLLPGSGDCAVLVTSRVRLTGLAGARVLDVDVFGHDEALGMLAKVIGEQRAGSEDAAAGELVRMVGHLPLALRIVAARLAARPHWSLAWMLERLSDERRRLDELAHGELVVRSSLALSYDGLSDRARLLLRLLSALDGTAFPPWVAAALLDTDLYQAAELLETLVDAQMVEFATTDRAGELRYRLHGLIRLFAREHLHREDPADHRDAALGRVVGGWLALAAEAHRRIYGGDFTVLHGNAPLWHHPAAYLDEVLADPLGWLESEHTQLCSAVGLAADAGLDEPCWNLATTLVTLFEARCYFDDWERTHLRALEAVTAAGNRRGEAALLCSLSTLHLSRSQLTAAGRRLDSALVIFSDIDDPHGRAMALRNRALLEQRRGREEHAMESYRSALEEFTRVGDSIGRANVLLHMARIELDREDEQGAARHLDEAFDVCGATGGNRVRSQARYVLSDLMQHQGRYEEADAVLRELLGVVRESRDMVGEIRILRRLGSVNARLGRREEAERQLREAVEICEQAMDQVAAAETRLELARLLAD